MWFTFVTARLFHSLGFQPRLAATLLSSCSVANSRIRRGGLSPAFRSSALAQQPSLSEVNRAFQDFSFFRWNAPFARNVGFHYKAVFIAST